MSEVTTRTYSEQERTRVDESAEEETEKTDEYVCPECGGRLDTDEERGETVCSECGLVVEEDEIDRGPEWRAFDAAEKDQKSRVGAPTTNMMHDKG
ncbi:MAG: TFIIB-type zinc ribbon-containing protein, partial [Halodesulfurarchaeum sp.]